MTGQIWSPTLRREIERQLARGGLEGIKGELEAHVGKQWEWGVQAHSSPAAACLSGQTDKIDAFSVT